MAFFSPSRGTEAEPRAGGRRQKLAGPGVGVGSGTPLPITGIPGRGVERNMGVERNEAVLLPGDTEMGACCASADAPSHFCL